jgi:hypothetical protein
MAPSPLDRRLRGEKGAAKPSVLFAVLADGRGLRL